MTVTTFIVPETYADFRFTSLLVKLPFGLSFWIPRRFPFIERLLAKKDERFIKQLMKHDATAPDYDSCPTGGKQRRRGMNV